MDRINDPSAPNRRWVAKDPNVAGSGTIIKKDWLQAVDDELANAIESVGLTLNPARGRQLADALEIIERNAVAKSPFFRVTPNQRLLNWSGGYPSGFETYGLNGTNLTIEHTVISGASPSSRPQVVQDLLIAMGANAQHVSHSFNVVKLTTLDAGALFGNHVPAATIMTTGAWVKLLSGSVVARGWAKGATLGEWKFCYEHIGPITNMGYFGSHAYSNSAGTELLLALPAVVAGYFAPDKKQNWGVFPFVNNTIGIGD